MHNLLLKRKRAWQCYTHDKSNANAKLKFLQLRRKCKFAIRVHFDNCERKILQHRNTAAFYRYINKRLKVSHQLSRLQHANGSSATNAVEIANILATEFQQNYSSASCSNASLASGITVLPVNECPHPIFSPRVVYNALRNVSNSSAGPDDLPGCLFRNLAAELTPPLVIIFQQSFFLGKLPEMWKLAAVKPIYKKGSKDLAANYRPISLTCVACKLMEGIVRDVMYNFLNNSGVISQSQHGFRHLYSSQTSLLLCYNEYVRSVEDKCDVDVILFDFSKAFDAVNHGLLLSKMKEYKFDNYIIAWVTAFLSERKQYVLVGCDRSATISVPSGVIQGSVLGPLLFLIFINDLPTLVKSASVFLYADDLKLVYKVRSHADVAMLQADVDIVHQWSQQWLLPLNADKLFHLHIGWRHVRNAYKCGSMPIKSVDDIKDLGVLFNSSLSFRNHINLICKKANGTSALLRRSFETRDPSLLMVLFNTYIRPMVEYCTCVWSPNVKTDVTKLERIQRHFTKRILPNCAYSERLSVLGIKTLEHRRLYFDLMFLFKVIHGKAGLSLSSLGISCGNSVHFLRGKGFVLHASVVACTNIGMYSFTHRATRLWNMLPRVAQGMTLPVFAKYIYNLDLVSLYMNSAFK